MYSWCCLPSSFSDKCRHCRAGCQHARCQRVLPVHSQLSSLTFVDSCERADTSLIGPWWPNRLGLAKHPITSETSWSVCGSGSSSSPGGGTLPCRVIPTYSNGEVRGVAVEVRWSWFWKNPFALRVEVRLVWVHNFRTILMRLGTLMDCSSSLWTGGVVYTQGDRRAQVHDMLVELTASV